MTSALLYELVQVLRSTTELKGTVVIVVDEMRIETEFIKVKSILRPRTRTKQFSDGNCTPNDNRGRVKHPIYHMGTSGIDSVIVKWRSRKGEKRNFWL